MRFAPILQNGRNRIPWIFNPQIRFVKAVCPTTLVTCCKRHYGRPVRWLLTLARFCDIYLLQKDILSGIYTRAAGSLAMEFRLQVFKPCLVMRAQSPCIRSGRVKDGGDHTQRRSTTTKRGTVRPPPLPVKNDVLGSDSRIAQKPPQS